jgi:F-type H+-transporting ATPase subunit alpha
MAEQIIVLVALNQGVFDEIEISRIAEAKTAVREMGREELSELFAKIDGGEKLTQEDIGEIERAARQAVTGEQQAAQPEEEDHGTA